MEGRPGQRVRAHAGTEDRDRVEVERDRSGRRLKGYEGVTEEEKA